MPSQSDFSDEEAARRPSVPLDGYPSFSNFVASDPDRTALIFKRFNKLAVRNILYLQSELAELQARQEQYDAEDKSIEHGDDQSRECAMNWETFRDASKQSGNEKQRLRMELMRDVQVRMRDYREALLQESSLASLAPPPSRTFEAINDAFHRRSTDGKHRDPILGGCSADLYRRNNDLVLLRHPEHQDRLTAFMHKYLSILFISGKRNDGTAYVPEQRIARFVTIISIVLAVLLLFIAIITLYAISSPAKKLGMISVYMLLFAGCVGLFTAAKRSEIFAATAAYAAVLVVFVSGNLGSKE